MFDIKATIIGDVTKEINGENKLVRQEIILGANKLQSIKISNDLYLSFPHLYGEILLDNISITMRYFKIEVVDVERGVKREWLFTLYKNTIIENKTKLGVNTMVYLIKGLSIPKTHLNKRITKVYDKPSTEVIVDLMDDQDENYEIEVESLLNTSSLNWNRVNMTDLQFFNFLKEYTQLVNNFPIIPMFFLKDYLVDTKIHRKLVLQNMLGIEASDVKFNVNFADILITTDIYTVYIESNNRRNYLHTTTPYFNTIGGDNRKNQRQFSDSILTEFVNSPNVIVNNNTNNKYKAVYENSSDITFPKITDGYYLNMIELGNVFSIENYENQNGGLKKTEISYFNIIGYELELYGAEANTIIKSNLIVSKLK